MEERKYLYKCPDHTGNLNEMRLQDQWCDVTIRVNGVEIRAHKVILAANLRYFKIMLLSDSFQESKKGVITMESVEGADLEEFISYAYTGEILVTDGNALNLLELANYLGEDGIKKVCITFLEKNLKVEDALRAYTFANAIECLSLKNVAKSKILLNLHVCSQRSDYLNFDYESLMDVFTNGKRQPVESQQTLFEGIMRWIMHDANKRKIRMSNLLNSISLTKLTTEYFMKYLANEAYRNDEHGVIKDILICYRTSQIEQKQPERLLLTVGRCDRKFHFQLYNFTKKQWSPLKEVPDTEVNIYSNSVIFNDQLYYTSGRSERYGLQRFDPATTKNIALHSPNLLKWSTLCACSRFVYLCGGVKDNKSKSDQVLRYDPLVNTFELLAPTQKKRVYSAAIFYQESLLVLGGYDGTIQLSSVEKYDAVTKQWMSFPSMREPRYGFGVAVLGGKLYAYGGINKRTEVYDPEKNSWQFLASMNRLRIHFFSFAHEGKLLAIRGNQESTAEVYDPSKNQWQMDHQLSSGLEISNPRGGIISKDCVTGDE